MNLEDVRLTLANQLSALDVMDGILALKEETKLKVIIQSWCWWEARNKLNQGGGRRSTEEICNSIVYHYANMEKMKLSPLFRPSHHNQK